MDSKQKYLKWKIKYKQLLNEINESNIVNSKINGGNINMEEDYVFQQSEHQNISMKNRTSLTLKEAIEDLNNYFK